MKTVNVHKAEGRDVEDAELVASTPFAFDKNRTLSEVAEIFESDAKEVVEFLTKTLPQGTVDRVIAILLKKKASHFIYPWWEADVKND